ncbi:putative transmembrane protein [Pseudomassariella vexata]|uniref:Putative transmembrane protein n=1 Tax=Pseudomassariella vexata TaxID=1141098 RepID=A0A1Y2DP08_9PEZI|nr:putative transmembrane protein [Pseudomassariella vexata]ORY61023.1 putative transmembrane protein [Pseudomassariella vexata]
MIGLLRLPCAAYNNTTANRVYVPTKPPQVTNSTAFELKVRPAGSESVWETVPLYGVQTAEINATSGSNMRHASNIAYFDFDGSVEITITPSTSAFSTIDAVRIRPLSYGIEATVSEGIITFRLSQPQNNVVVEVNGDIFNVIHIWTNTLEKDPITEAQTTNDSSIIYFGPGYHSLNEGKGNITLQSGQTLYFAAGAVINAGINIQNVSDVTIRGRGFLYKPPNQSILIEYSQNVVVDGISVLNPTFNTILTAVSTNVHISNIRTISAGTWGDGLDVFCSQNVLIERVFLRTSDDSIALYQHRWGYYGNSSNITVRDASLWADVAHPINIGTHGNADEGETAEGFVFDNIDILDHREPQVDYQGCIAFTVGDENLYHDMLFRNIRVEDFRWGMLLSLRVVYNTKYNLAPGRGLRNVTFRNLSYNGGDIEGHTKSTPIIAGYSPERLVEFVDFQNLTINGLHIWDDMRKPTWYQTSDFVPMVVTSLAQNITFSS